MKSLLLSHTTLQDNSVLLDWCVGTLWMYQSLMMTVVPTSGIKLKGVSTDFFMGHIVIRC